MSYCIVPALFHILAELHTALGQEVFALRRGAAVALQQVVGLVRLSRTVVAGGQQEESLL